MRILITSILSSGHLNPSLAIGQQLKYRGHEVYVAEDTEWTETIKSSGLDSIFFQVPEEVKIPKDLHSLCMKDSMRKPKGLRIKDESQIFEFLLKYNEALDGIYKKIIKQYQPDLILIDSVFPYVCIVKGKIPWIRIMSNNPLYFDIQSLPPSASGLRTDLDQIYYDLERQKRDAIFENVYKYSNEYFVKNNGMELPDYFSHFYSPFLNFYVYPKELDYFDEKHKLSGKWIQLDYCSRTNNNQNYISEEFLKRPGKMIYLSFGTTACYYKELMQRILDFAGEMPHNFIVTLGSNEENFQLYDNMLGKKSFNQIDLLPMMDLVISHGGNNTFCECIYFGVPMIIAPFFSDQIDNAARLVEKGMGFEINPYFCTKKEFQCAIDTMLQNDALTKKYKKISNRIQNDQRFAGFAADQIEKAMTISIKD